MEQYCRGKSQISQRDTRKKKEKTRGQPKSARAIRQAEENIPTNQLIDRRREEERAETGAEQSDEGNTQ